MTDDRTGKSDDGRTPEAISDPKRDIVAGSGRKLKLPKWDLGVVDPLTREAAYEDDVEPEDSQTS